MRRIREERVVRTIRMGLVTLSISLVACGSWSTAYAEEEKAAVEEAVEEKDPQDDDWMPGKFSGKISLFSDYNFRGISQTQREMALQGGIDWNHETGIFLGTWGSSIRFAGTDGFLEQDFYGGYAGTLDAFSYSISSTFFYYPLAELFNYWEFAVNTGYDFGFMKPTLGFIGSPDYFGTLGTGFYIPAGIAVPIPWENDYVSLTVDTKAGYTHTEQIILEDSHHYWDWSLGMIVGLPFGLSLDLRYVDTDLDDTHDAGARFIVGATFAM